MKKTATALVVMLATALGACAQTAIGHWHDHLSFSATHRVQVAGNGRVYAAANLGMFYYDRDDQTLTRMTKVDGLSDAGIATFAYDERTKTLVVAYNNSNVDLVIDDRVFNISDIKRNDNLGNKAINSIRFHNRKAYLSCGFGIVVLDLDRKEIGETYHIGQDGTYTAVYDLAFTADSIYAATAEGLKHAPTNARYLTISDLWEPLADSALTDYTVTTLDTLGGALVATAHSFDPTSYTLFRKEPTGFAPMLTADLVAMHRVGAGLLVASATRVDLYDTHFAHTDSLLAFAYGNLEVNDADLDRDGTYWLAHPWAGLLHCSPQGDRSYYPNGPVSADNTYRLMPYNNTMMLCPGGKTTTYSKLYNTANLLTYRGTQWEQLDRSNHLIDSASDLLDAVVNPFDSTEIVAALWGDGVLRIVDGKPELIYNDSTTGGALQSLQSGRNRLTLTGALAFDDKENLWVANSGQTHALAVRRKDGSWQKFNTSAFASAIEVDKIIWDSITDFKLMAGRANTIYVHDGDSRLAYIDPNNGSKLRTETVNCMAQDQNGDIWIGTNKGIKVIYDAYRAFDGGGNGEKAPVNCSNITITNGDFYEYLMAYENITSIAVDGANRKWVGTAAGGLYLISANGMQQLQHFTTANSPLFSDKVVSVAVQPRSGEVFVGTDRGLLSYRGTATYGDYYKQERTYAFPNPVRPGYDGPIAIKGLPRGAVVHITDAAGRTVYSAHATGGQAVWDGRTLDGQKVASGVYYAFAANQSGHESVAVKILIIR